MAEKLSERMRQSATEYPATRNHVVREWAAKVEQLERDQDRMDWLAQNHEFDIWYSTNRDGACCLSIDDRHGGTRDEKYEVANLRDAIDQAIEAAQKEKANG